MPESDDLDPFDPRRLALPPRSPQPPRPLAEGEPDEAFEDALREAQVEDEFPHGANDDDEGRYGPEDTCRKCGEPSPDSWFCGDCVTPSGGLVSPPEAGTPRPPGP